MLERACGFNSRLAHSNPLGGWRSRQRACFTRKRPQVRILYRPPLLDLADVVEWQTRRLQESVLFGACRFDSCRPHCNPMRL